MQYSKNQVLEISKGDFFGKGNAQLPNSLMLMIDEINHISNEGGEFGKGEVNAYLQI